MSSPEQRAMRAVMRDMAFAERLNRILQERAEDKRRGLPSSPERKAQRATQDKAKKTKKRIRKQSRR